MTWLLPQTPVTDEDLRNFESLSGLPLPEDFKSWLFKHNGACPEPAELRLEKRYTIIINSFLSFSEKDSPNVLVLFNMMRHRLPDGLCPIAEDHAGNYICFRYSSRNIAPDLVFWDHEEADPSIAVVSIATSFTELIRLLEKKV